MYPPKQIRRLLPIVALASLALFGAAHAEDWATFGKTSQRQGYNGQETILTDQTVPGLHQLWQFPMNGPILTQPLLASGVPFDDGSGTGNAVSIDLIYVADLTGLVAAFDAGGGGMVWGNQMPALQTSCPDFPGGTVGFVGTPTIDNANNRMWIVAADGTLWALALDTGNPLPGYPLQVIDPDNANGATINYGGLTYWDGSLYVTTASQCDVPPYFGQLIKIAVGKDSNAKPQVIARWYPTIDTGVSGGGIWGFGGVSLEADGSYFYAATGNALTQPENVGYANQIVKLDTHLKPVAANAPGLTGNDVDFGATPTLYQAPHCPPQLAVMNKTGELFVYDRDALHIASGPKQRISVTQTEPYGDFIGLPAYDPISQHLYLGSPRDDVSGKYTHGLLAFRVLKDCTLSLQWQQSIGMNAIIENGNNPMIPPTIAAGVVYYSTGIASSIFAFNSAGKHLWDSGKQIAGGIFAPPTVINGMLLVADYQGNLTAFGP